MAGADGRSLLGAGPSAGPSAAPYADAPLQADAACSPSLPEPPCIAHLLHPALEAHALGEVTEPRRHVQQRLRSTKPPKNALLCVPQCPQCGSHMGHS